jgi:capsular polysaccharide biosynthesis protein
MLEVSGGLHRFDRIVMPTRLSVYFGTSPRQRNFRRMMLPIAEKKPGRKRIYVSRRDARIRRVVNEQEIESILTARGFETVVASQLSPAAQAGAVNDAR